MKRKCCRLIISKVNVAGEILSCIGGIIYAENTALYEPYAMLASVSLSPCKNK